MSTRIAWFAAAGSLVLLACTLVAAEEGVRWNADYRQAAEQAARERKLVLLHFEADDCMPCRKLEANVFSRQEVATAVSAAYVPVKINVDRAPDLMRRYGVARWPTDVVVTPMGQEVYRQISPQDPAEYIAKLKECAARSGSGLARPEGAAPAATAAQPTPLQPPRSKTPSPDLSSEFQSPVIETGTPSSNTPAASPASPTSASQQYVAQPQTNPYVPQPSSQPYKAPQAPRAPSASGYDSEFPGAAGSSVASAPPAPPAMPAPGLPSPGPATSPQHIEKPIEPPANLATSPSVSETAPVASQPPAKRELPPVGMEGYCVVTLAEKGAWEKGDKRWGAIHRGRLYLFTSAECQKTFLTDPDRFAPALSGYDCVAFANGGKLVDGKRAFGLTYNNQVYLFSDEASLHRFETSPKQFADAVYQAMLRSDNASKLR